MSSYPGNLDGRPTTIFLFLNDARRDDHIRKHLLVDEDPAVLPEDRPKVQEIRDAVREKIGAYLESKGVRASRASCLQTGENPYVSRPYACIEDSKPCEHLVFCHDQLASLWPFYQRCIETLSKRQEDDEFLCHRHFKDKDKNFWQIELAGGQGLKVIASERGADEYNLNTAFYPSRSRIWERMGDQDWHRVIEAMQHDLLDSTGGSCHPCQRGRS